MKEHLRLVANETVLITSIDGVYSNPVFANTSEADLCIIRNASWLDITTISLETSPIDNMIVYSSISRSNTPIAVIPINCINPGAAIPIEQIGQTISSYKFIPINSIKGTQSFDLRYQLHTDALPNGYLMLQLEFYKYCPQ